mmetsp:Transcript_7534/g.10855  ORF Transcript_7534/g.10855 Transcript_7534/m.10855 type:complete len:254 (-) Transcript_7534:1383-2144(-)
MTPSNQSQKQSAQPPADDSTIATPDDETDSPVPSFQDRTVSCEVESQSSMAHSRCADENKAGPVTETSSSRSIQPQHEMGNTCDRESTTELTVTRDQSYGQQDTQIVSPVSTEATIADDVLRRRRENTGGSARSREVRTATGKNSGIPSKNSSRPNPATPSPPITSYEQLVQGSISANELFRAASDKLITSQAAKNVADIVSKEIKKQMSQPGSAVLPLNNMSSGHLHVPHLHSRMNRSHKKVTMHSQLLSVD